MSIQAVGWALDQTIPNAGLKLVLIALCNHADRSTGNLFLTHSTVEKEASMSRSSVQRHIKTLADMGVIEIGRNFEKSGRQSANHYRIIFDAAEQAMVAADRAAGGCQIDTLPDQLESCADAVDEMAGEGVNLTPRGSTGDTGEGVTADTPNTNHPFKPKTPLPPEGEEEGDFDLFWDSWPEAMRPESHSTVVSLFRKLSAEHQRRAIAGAARYRLAMACRSKPPLMIPYLKTGLYLDFHDEPEIDKDGDFIIRPGQKEWSVWLGDIRKRYGEDGVQSAVRHRMMCRKTRWPEGLRPSA